MNRHPVCLGFGSNLGDRAATLHGAIRCLKELKGVDVEGVSSFHETKPVGGPSGQGTFLNAAARIVAEQNPLELLNICREIEARFDRTREIRWGPRTLDIDILLFGDQLVEYQNLIVPHPRMRIRRFVLAPLAEIAGEIVDPLSGLTIVELLARLDRKPNIVLISKTWPESIREVAFERLKRQFGAVVIREETDAVFEAIGESDLMVCEDWNERVAARFQTRLGRKVEPTFAIGPFDHEHSLGSSVPTVRIESDDPDKIAEEIVDACAATRV
ncbi:MAG: hypothetical protein NVSMB14_10890 [Isosphaeraceae bacterium]